MRQDRRASRNPADEGQRELGEGRNRQAELARTVDGLQRFGFEPDAAGRAANQFEHAFASQRLQVFLGGVGRFETQFGGDFGAGGRGASAFDRVADQVEDLLLAGGKLGSVLHGRPF